MSLSFVEKRSDLDGTLAFARVLLAYEDDAPLGSAMYFVRGGGVWLDDLRVAPAHRGRGVGAALIARLRDLAAAHGCTHLAWSARADDPRALRFYQRVGATVMSRDAARVRFRLAV